MKNQLKYFKKLPVRIIDSEVTAPEIIIFGMVIIITALIVIYLLDPTVTAPNY